MGRAPASKRRPHSGPNRNESVRQAILEAALRLLSRPGGTPFTMEAIAAQAGVGKQTIYRWWPSKGAVLLEALAEAAPGDGPAPDTGSLRGDLHALFIETFRYARDPSVGRTLRVAMAEAQHDARAAELLRRFIERRRSALRAVLERGRNRGEASRALDLDIVIDEAFGLLWYRLLVGHAPLTRIAATALGDALVRQLEP
jgi:AcrR family transcriptional regulator